jgi:hypothetical protein
MEFGVADQRQEVISVVRDEDEVLLDDDPEQLRVGEPAPAPVGDVVRLVARLVRDADQRRGEALVDQEAYAGRGSPAFALVLRAPLGAADS